MQIIRHETLIGSDSRFVAQGPHDYRRVVFIPLKHTLYPVHKRLGPFGTANKIIPVINHAHAVRLKISFVTKINSKTIAKPGQSRIIGIMACAYHIDIVAFENIKVAQHMVKRGCRAEDRMTVVTVYSFCLDLLSVYVDHLVAHNDVFESNRDPYVLTAAGYAEGVKFRGLVRP